MKKKHIFAIIMLILGAGLIAAALGIVYSSPARDNPVDKAIADFFYVPEASHGIAHTIMKIVSYLGETIIYIAVLMILYYLWDKKKAYKAIVTVITSFEINVVAKGAFGFDRPDDSFGYEPVDEISYGLPSGHAQISTTFWGTLSAIVAKWGMITVGIALPLLIGFSRIFLTIHWFTDVLMGFGIGIIIIGLFLYLDEPVTKYVDKQSTLMKIFFVLLLFVVFAIPIIFIYNNSIPDEFAQEIKTLKILVMFTTASLAYVVEGKLVDFNSRADKWWKGILRLLIVIVPLAIIYVYDKILTKDMDLGPLKISLDMVIFGIMGPILLLLLPWMIKRLDI